MYISYSTACKGRTEGGEKDTKTEILFVFLLLFLL